MQRRGLGFVRLVAAVMLVGSGLIVAGPRADAQDRIPYPRVCNGTATNNPAIPNQYPQQVPVFGGKTFIERADTCVRPTRTLVFVGLASITNGVNMNGTGAPSASNVAGGGSFTFGEDCLMVDWAEPDVGVPVLCKFGNTTGTYFGPGDGANGLFNPVGEEIKNRATAAGQPGFGNAMAWAPKNQASCINSSGQGVSSFNVQETTGSETWNSSYTWSASLNNLRGWIHNGSAPNPNPPQPGHPAGSYVFDATIEAQAHPAGALQSSPPEPLDATAAGCLEKPLFNLAGQPTNSRTGLNSILIVGTATWDLRLPDRFIP